MKMKRLLTAFAAIVLLTVSLPLAGLAVTYSRVISKDALFLRNKPSMQGDVIGRYRTGTRVEVKYNGYRNWVQVRTPDGKTGYMYRKYLSSFSGSTVSTTPASSVRYIKSSNGGTVNYREKASAKGKVIAALKPGTKVTLLIGGRTWSKISYNGKAGWIKTRYLSKTK